MKVARRTGHFGEWFQGRLGVDGPVILVSLACGALAVEAEVVLDGAFELEDGGLVGVARAARFFDALSVEPQGRVRLTAGMPLGGGAGASTAGLLALADVMGVEAGPEVLAEACRVAEGAVDPLMFGAFETRLWASREAREVRRFGSVPEFDVVGGFWGAPQRTEAADEVFPDVSDLVEFWADAVERGDRAALAGIASEGARRVTAMRGPVDEPTPELARRLGALGWCRAHTGSARGLLFAPGRVPVGAEQVLADAGLAGVLTFKTGGAP